MFTSNMRALGLSRRLCLEFLRKQATLAGLSDGKAIASRPFLPPSILPFVSPSVMPSIHPPVRQLVFDRPSTRPSPVRPSVIRLSSKQSCGRCTVAFTSRSSTADRARRTTADLISCSARAISSVWQLCHEITRHSPGAAFKCKVLTFRTENH